MAPHLSDAELDFIAAKRLAGKSAVQIHALLSSRRARAGVDAPHLTNVRRALKGKTYKRSRKETRGRKATYSRKVVLALDRARKDLIKKTKNNREVRWQDVRKKAKAPEGHRSTLKRAFNREGIKVAARAPRTRGLSPIEMPCVDLLITSVVSAPCRENGQWNLRGAVSH